MDIWLIVVKDAFKDLFDYVVYRVASLYHTIILLSRLKFEFKLYLPLDIC